ncbi:glutamine synthetase family protein [Candidatus Enterovibrio altilux]|nr:glutamine synthetase family protein [Candidatus Enterovibrio luxaltus]
MDKLKEWLHNNEITEVECVVGDMSGIARGKISPVDKFISEGEMRLPESVLLQTVTGDYVDDDIYYTLLDEANIDFICKPDENAVYLLPWTIEKTAQIIHDTFDKMGNPIELTPRNVLKKVLKLYEERNWKPVVAPEMEFYLAARSADPALPLNPPIGRSGRIEKGRQSFSIDAANEFDPLFEDMYDWCETQGLAINTLIHEEGIAQMEINFRHGDPLMLSDQVFVFKRTLKEAALKHNVVATFMSKPITDEPGSAMHLHQSIWDINTGTNIFTNEDGTSSSLFYEHIAGLQQFIPKMLPLFAPNVNSFRRFLLHTSAPLNVEWGEENRTCGLRIPNCSSQNRRIENRLPGADANSYLVIAASLLCGYIGMIKNLKPTSPAQGRSYEIKSSPLPCTLESALESMENCDEVAEYLSVAFAKAFIAVKRTEHENFKRVISSWEREFLLLTV